MGGFALPPCCFSSSFRTSLTLASDEAKGSLPPCINDTTQSPTPILQLLYLCSLASTTDTFNTCCLLIFLPWSLTVVLTAHHAAQWLPGGHKRSALVDLPRLTPEQLIKKGDYFSWKWWGKHHQYFNYQMSAASHGAITTKHTHFYSPLSPSQTIIFIKWYHFWHQVMLKTRLMWIFINGIIFCKLKTAECVNNFEWFPSKVL